MKKAVALLFTLFSLIIIPACEKKPEVNYDLMSFNLFVFDELGADLANPKGSHPIDASQITISSEYHGKSVKWDVYRYRERYYDNTAPTTFNMCGFYYFIAETYDFCLDQTMINETMDVTVSIEGFPDTIVTFHFNNKAQVSQIDVNGKRLVDLLYNGYSDFYNVKIMYY